MNLIFIAWKNIRDQIFKKSLNIILLASGVAIINVIILVDFQLKDRLENNAGKVDLVIGAKGSPLQLILSGIYHIDFPTGNIKLSEVKPLIEHPYVAATIPLALGDSYKGFRIVGTNADYLNFYGLSTKSGVTWKNEFEAIAGSEVARVLNLKTGDVFHSSHGLTPGGDVHKDQFKLTGILKPSGTASDNLIITGLETIWHMHEHDDAHQSEQKISEREITALLVKYKTPLAIPVFPQQVNKIGALQAASPALETARLYALIGSGFDLVKAFGVLIMLLAAFSVFIVLYTSLSERKTELAIIRTMGASASKVFLLILTEGIIITFMGTLLGLFFSHVILQATGLFLAVNNSFITGVVFVGEEILVLVFGIVVGILASVIPAIQAYRTDISTVMAKG
ncbi:MAG: FtsX-like permease family protein [Bacteroidota bacterium]|nr:FtsX-like permease family protein [Bacteroidota bacterium]